MTHPGCPVALEGPARGRGGGRAAWWAPGPWDCHCLSGPRDSSPETSHWGSCGERSGIKGWGPEAQARFLLAAREAFQRPAGIQAARPRQDSVSEWEPKWGTWCPAVGCFPCPELGCWCAGVWRDQKSLKRYCTGRLGETEAGYCACWGPPSRALAQATLQMSRVLLGPGGRAADTCPLPPLQGSRSSVSWMVGRAGCPVKWSQPAGSGPRGWDTLCPRLRSRSCGAPGRMLGSSWELLLHSRMPPGQGSLDAHTCLRGTWYRSSPHALPRLPWVASGSCSQVSGHGGARKLAPAGAAGARTARGAGEACWPHSPTPLQPPSLAVTHTELWWAAPASPDKRGRNTRQAGQAPPGSPPPGSPGSGSQSPRRWVSPAPAGRGMAPRTVICRGASSPQRPRHSPGRAPHIRRPAAACPGCPRAGSIPRWGPRRVPGSPGGRSSGG